jgi:bloom syndrome protein
VQAPRTIVAEKRFPWSKEVDDKLRTYFKKPKFRFHQKEAIDETMAGKDGELAVSDLSTS